MKLLEEQFNHLKEVLARAKTMFCSEQKQEPAQENVCRIQYATLEEYKLATNKRFRRTAKEIERGLSAEEAFQERQIKS